MTSRHRYRLAQAARREAATAAFVEAALILIDAGDFRPTVTAIARGAGYTEALFYLRHRAVYLLMRDLARTRAPEIAAAIRKHWPGVESADDKALAWLVLVGKPRD
jgi:hypothetical protein